VSGSIDPLVAELIEDLANRAQAGEPIDVEAVIAAHPEHAEPLRRLLPAIEVLADLGRSASAGGTAHSQSGTGPEAASGVLGDFRIIREVGRGGMGIVYEAEQISLSRRVALKVLPFAATLDPRQLQRFKNEAQAAAGLQHQNIVPVYFVGVERGVHYYAMQFIDGPTVGAVIRELRQVNGLDGTALPPAATATLSAAGLATERSIRTPAYFRTVARLGEQAAEALQHAHDLGVIHRDVKPGNLMLDGRGNLWVTDFGLARMQTDASLTLTGDLVGTVRYMSPEQASGRPTMIDHRTDVYSLGATLYELLTLQPAFVGSDRQELLRQIAFEEPKAPRRVSKAIPAELETIVAKAMEKNPAERYATAQEMADDLRRWLEDRPIRATRPSWLQRFRKWTLRHRVAVSAATLILFATTLVSSVSSVLVWRAYQAEAAQRHLAEVNSEAAQEQQRRAEAHLDLGFQVLDEFYVDMAERRLPRAKQLAPEDRAFLEKALGFYTQFADQEGADPKARARVARARMRVAGIQLKLGQHAKAENAYRQAIARFEALAAEEPNEPGHRNNLAVCHNWLGALFLDLSRWPEADEAFRQGLAIRQGLTRDYPEEPNYRFQLAMSTMNVGIAAEKRRYPPEAEKLYRAALDLSETLVKDYPREARYRKLLAEGYGNLAVLLARLRRTRDAGDCFEQALTHLKALTEQSPTEPEYRADLATCYNNRGILQVTTGQPREAEESFHSAVREAERLAKEFPAVPAYGLTLANCYQHLGNVLTDLGRLGEAERFRKEGLRVWEGLFDGYPGVPEYRARWEKCAQELGWFLSTTDQHKEAIDHARACLKRCPDSRILNGSLARLLAICPDPTLRDVRETVELARKDAEAMPKDESRWNTLGIAYYRAGDWDAAIAALKQSMQLGDAGYSHSRFFLAMAHWRRGDKEQARRWYGEAATWLEENWQKLPLNAKAELRRFQAEAAELLGIKARPPADTEGSPQKDK
jgi:serine/threonine protein kinase/Flp pilus assembly protein TadD